MADPTDDAIADCEARIHELGKRLEKWDNRPVDLNDLDAELERIVDERGDEYAGLTNALYRQIETVCRIYLEGTDDQRARIRAILSGRRNLMSHFCGYPSVAAGEIRTPQDIEPLRIGLAAVSIENSSLDVRDLILSLETLYEAAVDAGIDPKPHFQDVAAISSTEPSEGGFSGTTMRDLLSRFHERM